MQAWNERLFFLINGDLASSTLDPVFIALTWLGAWPVAIPVVAILARADWRHFVSRELPVLAVAMLAVIAVTLGAKHFFDADRPIRHFRSQVRAGEVNLRLPTGDAPSKRSFPSGHTTISFFFLTALSLERRRHAAWALPLAAGIAWSRVYIGAHFPFDCVAGASLGASFAGGAHLVIRRLS